jgi:hypothetical protein
MAIDPYPNTYRPWPGPNSNTFLAHIARQVPELVIQLPSNAVGKDHLPWRRVPLSILNLLISLSFCRWAIGGRLNLPSIKKAGSTTPVHVRRKTLLVFRYLCVLWRIAEFTALPSV